MELCVGSTKRQKTTESYCACYFWKLKQAEDLEEELLGFFQILSRKQILPTLNIRVSLWSYLYVFVV